MHIAQLSLHDFRSYSDVQVDLGPGATTLLGRNGQGKTNLVEAIDYVSRLTSHRVAGDAPLVRHGTDQAVIRTSVVRHDRRALLEVELNPGRSNRARVNHSPLPRARDILGLLRTVFFSPEDLALVKGDPSERRRFLDDLLTLRAPRFAGVRADYDRVLRQRNSLLKSLGAARRGSSSSQSALSTLAVWDSHLARLGAELLEARLRLVEALRSPVGKAYESLAHGSGGGEVSMDYQCSFDLSQAAGGPAGQDRAVPQRSDLARAILEEVERRRDDELDRRVSLVGPHRDELTLMLGPLPARGYASHGESWSFALALRLASHDLLRTDGDHPVLILDDVFAELDTDRRQRLASLAAAAEQVLVTAAVPADVPAELHGVRFDVADGRVRAA